MSHPHNEEGKIPQYTKRFGPNVDPNDLAWDDVPPGTTTKLEYKSDAWHTVKVVLCTAIVFGFLSYLAYLQAK